jgi:hypothetical protein
MKKVVMPSKILWKGGIWGRGIMGDEKWRMSNSRVLKTPIKIGHLLDV